MELSYAKCEQIVKTLPIGYYAGRRIPLEVDTKAETSYYSPMEDKIIVSYPIIAERMSHMPEGSDEEEAVRSMLYHEVSHAILTPKNLTPNEKINIFEDERIESVLRNYYHNVNFRKQVYDMYGGHAPKAEDTMGAFYNAVRFGLGTGRVQTKINDTIKAFAHLNRNGGSYCDVYDYMDAIDEIYDLISKDFKDNPEAFNEPQSGSGKGQKSMDKLMQNQSGEGSDKEDGEGQNSDGNDTPDGQEGQGQEMRDTGLDEEAIKRAVGAGVCREPGLSPEKAELLNNFQKTVEMIIGNFNKKNSSGSGFNTYSGVFNPRATVRKDYRYFERSTTAHGNNKFGTCHLNLMIDCSGSFCNNVKLTNGILRVLSDVEKKNRNFSIDVVFINHELHKCHSVSDRVMHAWGGNTIPENIKQILLDLQKPQTCNYNIILFDGDAMCNNIENTNSRRKLFKAFDMKQTTLITDPDNKIYLGPDGFTSTKVIITRNYTDELIENITRALTVAFS